MVGGTIPAVELVASGSPADSVQTVDFAGEGHQLVLLFKRTCLACEATRPVWDDMIERLPAKAGVHAITGEPATAEAGYLASPRARVWHTTSVDVYRESFPPAIPVTMVVSDAGSISYARIGVLTPAAADSIVAMLERQTAEVSHAS